MSKEKLLSALRKPESAETEKNFADEMLKKIREDLNKSRYGFSKSKIKETRTNLYETESKKNLSKSKKKKIENNLLELEQNLSRLKKYYDYEDPEYIGIRDVGNLFNQSTDEDYYQPIKTTNSFDNKNNYIKNENKGDKDKILLSKEYLNMIRPYLSDMINDHNAPKKLRVHSSNKFIDYETQYGEWKIQLSMVFSSRNSYCVYKKL